MEREQKGENPTSSFPFSLIPYQRSKQQKEKRKIEQIKTHLYEEYIA